MYLQKHLYLYSYLCLCLYLDVYIYIYIHVVSATYRPCSKQVCLLGAIHVFLRYACLVDLEHAHTHGDKSHTRATFSSRVFVRSFACSQALGFSISTRKELDDELISDDPATRDAQPCVDKDLAERLETLKL